jgi:hypothetical protein
LEDLFLNAGYKKIDVEGYGLKQSDLYFPFLIVEAVRIKYKYIRVSRTAQRQLEYLFVVNDVSKDWIFLEKTVDYGEQSSEITLNRIFMQIVYKVKKQFAKKVRLFSRKYDEECECLLNVGGKQIIGQIMEIGTEVVEQPH